jgi:hypothetical protein
MIKLFNLDLHISVIKDIQYILNDIYSDKFEIVNWSLSGHSFIFNQNKVSPEFINSDTWKDIDLNMINNFVKKYSDFLKTFDGFIVTHTPIFCLLYETFNKPIILINSTRYEQPFSWNNNIEMWNYLNIKLKEMYDKKQLIAVSNNKADAKYLEFGTGIVSNIIPSLCLYTNSEYSPKNNKFIINNNFNISESDYIINKNNGLSNGYKWEELYSYKGIIHIPYEISTMSIFEQYSANIPLFFPSKKYLYELIKNEGHCLQSRYNKHNENNNYHLNLDKCLNDDYWLDFWINNADYYDEDNLKHIIYFDNNIHLTNLINNTDTNKIYLKMKEHNIIRKNNVYNSWKNIFKIFFENSEWDKNDLDGFKSCNSQNIGQISLNTKLGGFLFSSALNMYINNFLEIGTWNGLGSTKCFIDGFKNRLTSFKFYSLECNSEKSEYARKLYQNIDNVYILNEVLLNEMPKDINEVFPILLENSTYSYWNDIDFNNMKNKKLFFERNDLPKVFDLILLDGGEFTTWYEYNMIKDKCKILVLDDTNTFKCKKIVEDIRENNKWNILLESNERNGILICERKNN